MLKRERDCCDGSLKRHPSPSAVWLLPLVETFCTEQISWAELPFRPPRCSHTVDSPPCSSPVTWNVERKGGLNASLPKTLTHTNVYGRGRRLLSAISTVQKKKNLIFFFPLISGSNLKCITAFKPTTATLELLIVPHDVSQQMVFAHLKFSKKKKD